VAVIKCPVIFLCAKVKYGYLCNHFPVQYDETLFSDRLYRQVYLMSDLLKANYLLTCVLYVVYKQIHYGGFDTEKNQNKMNIKMM
jgi:hypothetical protein